MKMVPAGAAPLTSPAELCSGAAVALAAVSAMKKAKNLTIVPSASNAPVVLRSAIDPSCPQHLIKSKAQVSLPSVR
jgi:hypothetical protein